MRRNATLGPIPPPVHVRCTGKEGPRHLLRVTARGRYVFECREDGGIEQGCARTLDRLRRMAGWAAEFENLRPTRDGYEGEVGKFNEYILRRFAARQARRLDDGLDPLKLTVRERWAPGAEAGLRALAGVWEDAWD